MPSHTCVCPPAGFAQPPWPNPARNILRLGFRARDHFDIWAKSGPCPASYKAVHGWAELVADHATAGFGLPMAQTPLPVAGGMRCRCSIVSILRFPKLGSRSLLLGPAPGEKWSCARLLTKPPSGDGPSRSKLKLARAARAGSRAATWEAPGQAASDLPSRGPGPTPSDWNSLRLAWLA